MLKQNQDFLSSPKKYISSNNFLVILGVLSFLTFLPELTQFSASTLMLFFQDDVVAQVIDAKLLLPQVLLLPLLLLSASRTAKATATWAFAAHRFVTPTTRRNSYAEVRNCNLNEWIVRNKERRNLMKGHQLICVISTNIFVIDRGLTLFKHNGSIYC